MNKEQLNLSLASDCMCVVPEHNDSQIKHGIRSGIRTQARNIGRGFEVGVVNDIGLGGSLKLLEKAVSAIVRAICRVVLAFSPKIANSHTPSF